MKNRTRLAWLLAAGVVLIVGLEVAAVSVERSHRQLSAALEFPVKVAIPLLVLLAACLIGGAPGRIARERHHPQAEAIAICGWLGLLFTAGIGWVAAIVWAHTVPAEK